MEEIMPRKETLNRLLAVCTEQKAVLASLNEKKEASEGLPAWDAGMSQLARQIKETRAELENLLTEVRCILMDCDKEVLLHALIAEIEGNKMQAIQRARTRGNTMQDTHRALGEADALDDVLSLLKTIAQVMAMKSPGDF
jgi:recombinational DNA repair ATPase RecF